MTPDSDHSSSLNITGDAQPSVPTYACLVYVHTDEAGSVIGRVANLAGIESRGASERFVLSKVTQAFKAQVLELHTAGQEFLGSSHPNRLQRTNEFVRSRCICSMPNFELTFDLPVIGTGHGDCRGPTVYLESRIVRTITRNGHRRPQTSGFQSIN